MKDDISIWGNDPITRDFDKIIKDMPLSFRKIVILKCGGKNEKLHLICKQQLGFLEFCVTDSIGKIVNLTVSFFIYSFNDEVMFDKFNKISWPIIIDNQYEAAYFNESGCYKFVTRD